jgi:hypothetical protein
MSIKEAIEEAFGPLPETHQQAYDTVGEILKETVGALNTVFDKKGIDLKAKAMYRVNRCETMVQLFSGGRVAQFAAIASIQVIGEGSSLFSIAHRGDKVELNFYCGDGLVVVHKDEARAAVAEFFADKKRGALALRSACAMAPKKEGVA